MTVGFLSSEGYRSPQRNDDAHNFDKLFVDTLLPHLSYEALQKLCQSNAAVAYYVQMQKATILYRKALQYMQSCGYDAGTTHVDDIGIAVNANAEISCGKVDVRRSNLGASSMRRECDKQVLTIEAGRSKIVSWHVSSSPGRPSDGTAIRFVLEIELMTGCRRRPRSLSSPGARCVNAHRLTWTPDGTDAVSTICLDLVPHSDGRLEVWQQQQQQTSGRMDHGQVNSICLDLRDAKTPRRHYPTQQGKLACANVSRRFSLESYQTSTFAQRCCRTYGKRLSSLALKGEKNESTGSIRLLATFVSDQN